MVEPLKPHEIYGIIWVSWKMVPLNQANGMKVRMVRMGSMFNQAT